MNAREKLLEIRNALKRAEMLRESQNRLRDSVTRITGSYSGMPRGSSQDDRMLSYAARLYELDKQIDEMLSVHLEARREALEAVNRLEDIRQQQVIVYRYFDLMSWHKIARKMHYSVQHAFRLHAEALRALDELM